MIIEAEAAVFHERSLRDPARRALLDALIPYYLDCGRLYLATDYVKAQRLRALLQAELNAVFERVDVIAAPVTSRKDGCSRWRRPGSAPRR